MAQETELFEEVWKPVVGYEGLYDVSNFGNIKSLDRITPHGHKWQGRILRQTITPQGYYKVNLWKNGVRKTHKVHRLVLTAFIPNTENKPCVNHIDEVRLNNKLDNLEWATYKENNNHGSCQEKRIANTDWESIRLKQSSPVTAMDKITGEVISFPSMSEAGRNGFDQAAISRCCNGKLRSHGGYYWSSIDKGFTV